MACFKDRKKQQRKLNKIIKEVNQRMKDDSLWRGRFQIKQLRSDYRPFPRDYYEKGFCDDGDFYIELEFVDKKTGKTKKSWYQPLSLFENRIYVQLNDFIVSYCDVWSEEPSPYEQTEVYY